MEFNSINQITPEFVKQYRLDMKLSLDKFWGCVGCGASRGIRYEDGTHKIPETIKRLVFLQYGVGIPTECEGEAFDAFLAAMRNTDPLTVGRVANLIREAQQLLDGTGDKA